MTDTLTACPLSQATLAASGMTCASCEGRFGRSLNRAEGIVEASVNLAAGAATTADLNCAIE